MSKLVAIIDAYKDTHGGPSDSSVARAIGVKPQTLSSWRTRGVKVPPDRDSLRRLASLANLDYETVVLRAALLDAGWIEEGDGDALSAAPMNAEQDPLSERRRRVANSDLADLPSVAKKRKPRNGE